MNPKEIVKMLVNKDSNVESIAELERKLDISNGTINKWDKSKPGTPHLVKIADYFHVSTDYLLGRTDNPMMNDEYKDSDLIAAHIDGDLTEDEKADILKYIDFIRSQHK